jgi:L-asparaginase
MTRPTVHVIATGGTIASTGRDDGGAAPELDGEALVEAVPGLASIAELTVTDVADSPGFDVQLSTIAAVRDLVDETSGEAVVVTHGTDTMEETAFALDLLTDGLPVVCTGAQRRPDERSPDGPANLHTAVRAAVSDRLQTAGGSYLAFDDELHAARTVTKAHTSALDTFRSPDSGPLARAMRENLRWYHEPSPAPFSFDAVDTGLRVPVVTSGTGVDGYHLRGVVERGADGVVVAGTGLGNVTASLGDTIREISDRCPVVVASRCYAGPTEPVYGTPGGAHTLAEAGVPFAGDLQPWKARIALLLALANDADASSVFAQLTGNDHF